MWIKHYIQAALMFVVLQGERCVLLLEGVLRMNDDKRLWRKRLGDIGEALVMRYLTLCGWHLLRTKFRIGRSSEIDLVMRNPDGVTVFIEVKTRALSQINNQDWYESVSHTLNWRKQKKILSAARSYKVETADHSSEYRFDVVMLGLSSSLAAQLVRTVGESDVLHETECINIEASKMFAAKESEQVSLIHCESVFVTNF